jgi:hypothetical protein
MKRIVLTFGLIAGAVLSAMMAASMALIDVIGYDRGEIVGYTTMVLAFLLVFFGIRSYRDNVAGGEITFGKGFAVGLLIVAVASVCYVVTWQVIYFGFLPDFGERYAAHALEQARAAGATAEELAAQARQMARYAELYKNPLINAAITFLEPLPVGLVMALVSAGILRRKRVALAGSTVGRASHAV